MEYLKGGESKNQIAFFNFYCFYCSVASREKKVIILFSQKKNQTWRSDRNLKEKWFKFDYSKRRRAGGTAERDRRRRRKRKKKKFNKKWPDLFSVNAGDRCGFPVPLHQITGALMEQILRKWCKEGEGARLKTLRSNKIVNDTNIQFILAVKARLRWQNVSWQIYDKQMMSDWWRPHLSNLLSPERVDTNNRPSIIYRC